MDQFADEVRGGVAWRAGAEPFGFQTFHVEAAVLWLHPVTSAMCFRQTHMDSTGLSQEVRDSSG